MVQDAAPRYAGYHRRSPGHLIIVQKRAPKGGSFFVGWRAGRTAIRYPLPVDWYLLPIFSYASGTEILRFAQNDEPGGKGAAKRHTYSSPKAIPPSEPFELTRPSGRVKWRYHHLRRRRPMMPLERSEHNLLRSGHNLRGRRPRQPSPFEPSELSGPWGFSIALSASCFFSSLSVGRLT